MFKARQWHWCRHVGNGQMDRSIVRYLRNFYTLLTIIINENKGLYNYLMPADSVSGGFHHPWLDLAPPDQRVNPACHNYGTAKQGISIRPLAKQRHPKD